MNTPELDYKKMLREISLRLPSFEKSRSSIIPLLQDIQDKYAYLSPEVIKLVAEHLGISVCEVYGIATFYNQFRFSPPGKHQIKVCLGTACHLNNAVQNLEQIERTIDIGEGETTEDMLFSLETVNCVGTCALAPVTMVDEDYYGAVTPGRVEKILSGYSTESGFSEDEED